MSATTLVLLLLGHLIGDYILQSDWMATGKTQRWWPAVAHALTYTVCYLPATRSLPALAVIGGTHLLIDRYRLARHLIWAKNHLAPASARPPAWTACAATGYGPDLPAWLAVGLLIAVDNTVHLTINAAALAWL